MLVEHRGEFLENSFGAELVNSHRSSQRVASHPLVSDLASAKFHFPIRSSAISKAQRLSEKQIKALLLHQFLEIKFESQPRLQKPCRMN